MTDSYKNILPQSIIRRTLPPIMNAYGTLLLVGGAIQSSVLFFRKQILPNRVVGNVFIALGGLLPAAAGSIVKLAESTPELSTLGSTLKYLAILAGVLILFLGFQLTTAGASTQGQTRTGLVRTRPNEAFTAENSELNHEEREGRKGFF